MNDDARLITAALNRRFARAAVPACPDGAWQASATEPVVRPRSLPRKLAYAAALVATVAAAGLAAQASGSVNIGDMPFLRMFGSAKPLAPGIHAADRLTIAEAQRRMPFTIVVPTGLPANTRLMYAHVVAEKPAPLVLLRYEAHIGSKYYDISFNESTVAVGPSVVHAEFRNANHVTKRWNLPVRRWKHGPVVMQLQAWKLPAALSDRIVRANTL